MDRNIRLWLETRNTLHCVHARHFGFSEGWNAISACPVWVFIAPYPLLERTEAF